VAVAVAVDRGVRSAGNGVSLGLAMTGAAVMRPRLFQGVMGPNVRRKRRAAAIRVYAWDRIAYNRGPRRGCWFVHWLLCPAFLKIGPFTGPFSWCQGGRWSPFLLGRGFRKCVMP